MERRTESNKVIQVSEEAVESSKNWPSLKGRAIATVLTSLPTMTGGMLLTADRVQNGDEKAAIAIGISTFVGSIGLAHAIISWAIKDLRENPSGAGTF